MKQIWITRKGPPEVLMLRDAEDPSPNSNEIVIDVRASGVNFADLLARTGRYPEAPPLPMVPGYEVSGVVSKVGKNVSEDWLGKRVFAPTFFGGYSSKVAVPEEQVFLLPENLSFSQGAAIPVNYLTALGISMKLAHIKKGDRVLIYSAGGGVGLALNQFCKKAGAFSIGIASVEKHERLKTEGYKFLIDPKSDNLEKELRDASQEFGYDVIFDSRGGNSWSMGFRLLAPLGKLIAFGATSYFEEIQTGKPWRSEIASGQWYQTDIFDLTQANCGVAGFNLATLWKQSFSPLRQWLNEILEGIREGHLYPKVDREFEANSVIQAHQYLENRQNFGKVVLLFS